MDQEDTPRPSPDIQAVQARLLQMRAERGVPARDATAAEAAVAETAETAERPIAAAGAAAETADRPAAVNWSVRNAQRELARLRTAHRIVAHRPEPVAQPVAQPVQVVSSPQAGQLALQQPVEQPVQVVAFPQAKQLALQQPVAQPVQVVSSPQAGQVVSSPHTEQPVRQLSGIGKATSYSHSDTASAQPTAHDSNAPSSCTTSANTAADSAAIVSSMAARIGPNAGAGGTTPTAAATVASHHPSSVKVYPDIALGMLRGDQAAAGRVWLLLRGLDVDGRGWLAADEARAALCDAGSPLRICGRRRLRQLLAGGEGLFWQRDDRDRIWLRGPTRVAAGLGVTRLGNRPVDVPAAALLGGIGDVRAHLYATFHSGRARETTSVESHGTTGGRAANSPVVLHHSSLGAPIARDTLADLSGVCPRSQIAYERRAGIVARANIALGERVAAARTANRAAGGSPGPTEQERAWRHGRALFRLKDHRGRQGPPGATYLAWRLPNGYGAGRGHRQRPKGRQKRINRQLADLFTKGMTGNGESTIVKRFFPTAAAAFKVRGGGGAAEQGRKGGGGLGACRQLRPTAHRRPAAYWPLTTAHRSAVSGWGVWAVVDRAVADRAVADRGIARGVNPTAASRNLLKQVHGGPAQDADRAIGDRAAADQVIADRAIARGMNPTAASRNLLKQVHGGPARDANRLQPILIDRGGFESA